MQRRSQASLLAEGKRRAAGIKRTASMPPRPELEVARALVLAALGDLVDAGLGTWSERDGCLVELRLTSGQRWLLGDEGVTRLA